MNDPLPPTLPRPLLYAAVSAVFFVLVAIPAAAQNGSHGGNQAQAVLHIQANVVSYTMPPHSSSNAGDGPVVYDMPSRQPPMSVSAEIREFMVSPAMVEMGGRATQVAVLKTLTIVPQ